jgi:hypothetical protein
MMYHPHELECVDSTNPLLLHPSPYVRSRGVAGRDGCTSVPSGSAVAARSVAFVRPTASLNPTGPVVIKASIV